VTPEERAVAIWNELQPGIPGQLDVIASAIRAAVEAERARIVALLRAVPLEELGEANYGEGTCTSWEEHVEEHFAEDEDDRGGTTYTMIVEGAERVRDALVAAAEREGGGHA